jgi:hypothetical protein
MNSIYFTARLTEADTGVKANSSSQAEISYSNLEIELIEPLYFKPGFPINFKVSYLKNLKVLTLGQIKFNCYSLVVRQNGRRNRNAK